LIYWNGSGSAQGASGWQGIGGTSAAAPVWAAAIALMNASPACGGSIVGFANPALYKAAASAYAQDFNDITGGNNDFTGTNGGRYSAGAAYDMGSGLGTLNAAALDGSVCRHTTKTGSPAVSASLSGVKRLRPTLRLSARAGNHAPALRAITIRLPSGLRFARKPGRVTVTGPGGGRLRFSAAVTRGVLTVTLAHTATGVTVTIRYASITATKREATAVRRGQAGRVVLIVTVTNARGSKTRLTPSVKPS
jgi:hypothetical protein